MAGILDNEKLKTQAEELSKNNGLPTEISGLLVLANLHQSGEAVKQLQGLFKQPGKPKEKPLTPEQIRQRITELEGMRVQDQKDGRWADSSAKNRQITTLRNTLQAMGADG